MALDSLF